MKKFFISLLFPLVSVLFSKAESSSSEGISNALESNRNSTPITNFFSTAFRPMDFSSHQEGHKRSMQELFSPKSSQATIRVEQHEPDIHNQIPVIKPVVNSGNFFNMFCPSVSKPSKLEEKEIQPENNATMALLKFFNNPSDNKEEFITEGLTLCKFIHATKEDRTSICKLNKSPLKNRTIVGICTGLGIFGGQKFPYHMFDSVNHESPAKLTKMLRLLLLRHVLFQAENSDKKIVYQSNDGVKEFDVLLSEKQITALRKRIEGILISFVSDIKNVIELVIEKNHNGNLMEELKGNLKKFSKGSVSHRSAISHVRWGFKMRENDVMAPATYCDMFQQEIAPLLTNILSLCNVSSDDESNQLTDVGKLVAFKILFDSYFQFSENMIKSMKDIVSSTNNRYSRITRAKLRMSDPMYGKVYKSVLRGLEEIRKTNTKIQNVNQSKLDNISWSNNNLHEKKLINKKRKSTLKKQEDEKLG